MARYVLHVPNIEEKVFEAYWYGYGTIVSKTEGNRPGTVTVDIDYGADKFRADCQDGRFASGLYFSKLDVLPDEPVYVCPLHGPQSDFIGIAGSVLPHCPVPGCGRMVTQTENIPEDEAF